MMMKRFHVAIVCGLAVAAFGAHSARAQDEAQAESDWKELEAWLSDYKLDVGATPEQKAEANKKHAAEAESRLRAFIDKHKAVAKYATPARYVLGRMMLDQHKPEKALPLLEDAAKSDDPDMKSKGRFYLVEALCQKGDVKAARARLDAFKKDDPDSEDLKKLDEHVKKLESMNAKSAALKKGAPAPAVVGLALDGSEFTLDPKGKVALVEFNLGGAPPFKAGVSALKKIADHWKDKLVVVTVLIDPDVEKAKKSAKDATWTVLAGEKATDCARDWGIKTVPSAYIIKEGKIAALGVRSDRPEDLASEIEYVITGKRPKSKDDMSLPGGE